MKQKDFKKEILNKIKSNTKKINPKAYVSLLNEISEHRHSFGPLNGDCTLTRLSAVCNVVARHNYTDEIVARKQSIDLLNQWRSLQGCKPDGFHELVERESLNLFFAMIDAGFGEHQLKATCWLFSIETLEMFELWHWRKENRNELAQSNSKAV